jgi:hypothetical protein
MMTYAIVSMALVLTCANEQGRYLLINISKLCCEICFWVVVAVGLFGAGAWALSVV